MICLIAQRGLLLRFLLQESFIAIKQSATIAMVSGDWTMFGMERK